MRVFVWHGMCVSMSVTSRVGSCLLPLGPKDQMQIIWLEQQVLWPIGPFRDYSTHISRNLSLCIASLWCLCFSVGFFFKWAIKSIYKQLWAFVVSQIVMYSNWSGIHQVAEWWLWTFKPWTMLPLPKCWDCSYMSPFLALWGTGLKPGFHQWEASTLPTGFISRPQRFSSPI